MEFSPTDLPLNILLPAAIRQLFSRFRRRSAPIVIVFSTDERVFVEVSAAIAYTPEPVPAKLCGCHGSAVSVSETGHAMLAASEARCMAPGKKLKAKGIVEGYFFSALVRPLFTCRGCGRGCCELRAFESQILLTGLCSLVAKP